MNIDISLKYTVKDFLSIKGDKGEIIRIAVLYVNAINAYLQKQGITSRAALDSGCISSHAYNIIKNINTIEKRQNISIASLPEISNAYHSVLSIQKLYDWKKVLDCSISVKPKEVQIIPNSVWISMMKWYQDKDIFLSQTNAKKSVIYFKNGKKPSDKRTMSNCYSDYRIRYLALKKQK